MAVRILIADSDAGHAATCKAAIVSGYGLGNELITSQTDRDFSGATNWQSSGLSGFSTNGNLELSAYDVGVGYCNLANTNFNVSVGKKYLLEYEVVYELDAGWDLYIGTQSLGKTGTSVGVHTVEFTLTTDGTGANGIKLVPGTYSAVFDNFSLKETPILSSEIEVKTSLALAIAEATSNSNIVAILRSYSGVASSVTSFEALYPTCLGFFPLGSNTFEELTVFTNEEPPVIVTSGAGNAEAQNNTAYGKGLEFWDDDLDTSAAPDLSSFSNGVILGKLLKIKDTLSCTWWEARYRARTTATQTEANRVNLGWDLYNGYGKINVDEAIAYVGVIPVDPYYGYDTSEVLTLASDLTAAQATIVTRDATIAALTGSSKTLKEYVEDYIGTFSDTDALTTWLTLSTKKIIDLLPYEELEKYCAETNIPYAGLSLKEYRVFKILRGMIECRKIQTGLERQISDSDSIHYPIDDSPVYLNKLGTIKVYPQVGNGATATVSMTAISGGYEVNTVTIVEGGTNYDSSYATCTFAGTLTSGGAQATGTPIISAAGVITGVTVITKGSYTGSATITFSCGSQASALAIAYPSVAYTSSFPVTGIPPKLEGAVILYAAIQAKIAELNTLLKTTLTGVTLIPQVSPTAPSAPSFTYTDAAYTSASYSVASHSVTDYIAALISSINATAIGSLGTPPIYGESSVTLTTDLSSLDLSDIVLPELPTDLSIGLTIPTPPGVPTYSYSNASLGDYQGIIIGDMGTPPTYTKTSLTLTTAALSDLNLATIVLPSAPAAFSSSAVPPSSPTVASYSYTDASIGTFTAPDIDALSTTPVFIEPVPEFNLTNATTYIATDEDLEKASVEIQKQNMLLESYAKKIDSALSKFNSDMDVVKVTAQRAIEQAKIDQEMARAAAEKTTDMNLVNAAKKIESEIKMYETVIQKYAIEMQAYATKVNAEVNIYQAEVQAYATVMQGVGIQVNSASTQFKLNMEYWATKRTTELSKYQLDIQDELHKFNKELAIYQAGLQKALEQARLDSQRLIQKSEKQTDLNIINASKTLEASIKDYEDTLQEYLAKIQAYGAETTNKVQEYQTKLERYKLQLVGTKTEVEKKVSEFTGNLNLFQIKRQTELGKYERDIQNKMNSFQKELSIYQSTVQSAIKQAELTQQKILEEAQLQAQLAIANAKNEADITLQNAMKTSDVDVINKAKAAEVDIINKGKAMELDIINKGKSLEKQVVEYKSKLEKYQTEIMAYQNNIQQEVQRVQTEIQKNLGHYESATKLVEMLKREYNEIIQPYIGGQNGK